MLSSDSWLHLQITDAVADRPALVFLQAYLALVTR